MDLTYLKLLLITLVGSVSFYTIYVLQGINAAILLVSQNLFTVTVLAFLIDTVKKPEKIIEHLNNIKGRNRDDKKIEEGIKRIEKALLEPDTKGKNKNDKKHK